MQNNPKNFSAEEAMRLAKTPAGQQLIAMLQKADTNAVKEAMTQAASGNMEQAKNALGPILASPEIRQLIQQLGGK